MRKATLWFWTRYNFSPFTWHSRQVSVTKGALWILSSLFLRISSYNWYPVLTKIVSYFYLSSIRNNEETKALCKILIACSTKKKCKLKFEKLMFTSIKSIVLDQPATCEYLSSLLGVLNTFRDSTGRRNTRVKKIVS